MSIKIIQQRLQGYGCMNEIEEQQAIREITQEVILAALGRGGFFQACAISGRHLPACLLWIEPFF